MYRVDPNILWWVIPGVLAGMRRPFLHPERRTQGGDAQAAYDDELTVLQAEGIRAVVSLLNVTGHARIYEAMGFAFLCLPVPDGCPPTLDQAAAFVQFVETHRVNGRPVAVHCEAGIGRTGTLLAAYLISEGADAGAAIARVRSVEPAAIETTSQENFLYRYARSRQE